ALGTRGSEKGQLTLDARSLASAAGTPEELLDKVLERLLESGEIKVWKAKEIIDELRREQQQAAAASVEREANGSESFGYGKIILTGEHSVVFGKHAVAAPIALKMKAKVWERPEDVCLIIPQWGVEHILQFEGDHRYSVYRSLEMILKELELRGKAMTIKVTPEFPKAMGMGGSAALAVAIIRALNQHYELGLTDRKSTRLNY